MDQHKSQIDFGSPNRHNAVLSSLQQTQPAQHDGQSRDVRRGNRQRHHDDPSDSPPREAFRFNLQITLWLWFTVLFANFAEAMAEGRGKAQAESSRADGDSGEALQSNGRIEEIPSAKLRVRRPGRLFLLANSFPATEKSSKAWRPSTSPLSQENPRL